MSIEISNLHLPRMQYIHLHAFNPTTYTPTKQNEAACALYSQSCIQNWTLP